MRWSVTKSYVPAEAPKRDSINICMLQRAPFKMRYLFLAQSIKRKFLRNFPPEVFSAARIFILSTQVGGNMKKQRIKAVALSTVLTAGAVLAGWSHADQSLDAVLAVGQSKVEDAQKSQARINKLQDETSDLVAKFKQVSKTIE